jgi:hypothetical protein
MTRPVLRRRAGLAAVTTSLALAAALVPAAAGHAAPPPERGPATLPAAAAKPRPVAVFPTDALTVADPAQLTGRRVALPLAGCGAALVCATTGLLNQLDGFDLDPRISVRFDGPVDPAAVAERITVTAARGPFRTGVDRVVYDPATFTVHAHPARQLAPSTTYRVRVQGGPDNGASFEPFTTMSATDGLLDLRRQIDSGAAFSAAGIAAADRGLRVEGVVPAAGTTVTYQRDRAQGAPAAETIPALPLPAGTRYVFGSFLAPSWLQDDVTIPQTPTRDGGPAARGVARLPFVAVVPPAGAASDGGAPVAVFGHGFTASPTSVLLASVANAQAGIATIGTAVVGHGYGPESRWLVQPAGSPAQTFAAYGRGVDQDSSGSFGASEGSSATGAASGVASRDALRQTAADLMTLARAVAGTDVDGDGTGDLSGAGVTYVGQSFGGIYGAMLAGADPTVQRSVLNVPGGPVTEIARLSPSFRLLTTQALAAAGLTNSSDPSRAFFQEQLPLRGEGPVVATVPGALAIQDYLAKATWLTRPGSPEAFAPLIAPERVLVQAAFGDRTVPNPTTHALVSAGDLWSRTSLYRNDRTANRDNNPHSFLLQLPLPAALQGQGQGAAFLTTGQVVDPDGPGAVWEVPVEDPATLLSLNFPNPALRP